MAGHSKWANIQHRKGKQDAIRAKLFAKLAREMRKDEVIVVNLSGRGDKDVDTAMAYFGIRGVADRSTGALK
mgnify:CR=1 FL=1